jgi:hypothetical protein
MVYVTIFSLSTIIFTMENGSFDLLNVRPALDCENERRTARSDIDAAGLVNDIPVETSKRGDYSDIYGKCIIS